VAQITRLNTDVEDPGEEVIRLGGEQFPESKKMMSSVPILNCYF